MKSLQFKITAFVTFLLMVIGAAGLLSSHLTGTFFAIAITVICIMISVALMAIIVKILILNPLFRMKREVDMLIEEGSKCSFDYTGTDEFGELSNRLNKMVEWLNSSYTDRKTGLIKEISDRENSKYLKNINEGLLFIDYGQFISEFYSHALAEIFDRSEISGQHFSDFLYPQKEEEHEKRKVLEKFIIGLFNEPEQIENIKEEDNPLHNIWISRDDGQRILVDGTFKKVEEKGELVQLMIIFRDRTEEGILEKKLDEKDMRSDFELESIVAILRSGPGPFLQFIEESEDVLERFRVNIPGLEDKSVLEESFRNINTMKCSAVYFDFRAVEKLCHNLEDILVDFRVGENSRKEALDIIVDDIYTQFENIGKLIDRFQEFLSSAEGRVYETHRNDQEHFFDSLKIMMSRHADELGKEIDFSFSSDFDNFRQLGPLKNPVIHLLRNAVDHGVEEPEDRTAHGKEEKGRILLTISSAEDETVKITVEDDGRGIDFDKLRKRAVQMGFIKKEEAPGQANLIRTLFRSGYSSRDEMAGLSGRGVGLDAVKESVSRMGGKISVKTERLKGSRFTITLPSG